MTTPKTATVTLSDYPFVLVELVGDVDEPLGFRLDISAGGGISDEHYVGALLRIAATNFPTEPAE